LLEGINMTNRIGHFYDTPSTRYGESTTRRIHLADLEQALDQQDQQTNTAGIFYSGVFAGFIYGAFAVLVWKWLR
jgi:hypothetical protein